MVLLLARAEASKVGGDALGEGCLHEPDAEPLLAASAILDERPTPIRVAVQAEVGVGAGKGQDGGGIAPIGWSRR